MEILTEGEKMYREGSWALHNLS